MALPGRTPRSYGTNRVSGEISCEFPGLARRAGVVRLCRPVTMLTAALESQPSAGAEAGLAGALPLYRGTGATASIYRGDHDLDPDGTQSMPEGWEIPTTRLYRARCAQTRFYACVRAALLAAKVVSWFPRVCSCPISAEIPASAETLGFTAGDRPSCGLYGGRA